MRRAPSGRDAGARPERAGPRRPARELLQSVMEEISGGRMHYMFNRVGGLKEELPAGWLGRVGAAAAEVRGGLPRIGAIVAGSEEFRGRTRGVGVLTGGAGAAVRGERPGGPGLRGRFRPAPGRALPGLRRAGRACCGW